MRREPEQLFVLCSEIVEVLHTNIFMFSGSFLRFTDGTHMWDN